MIIKSYICATPTDLAAALGGLAGSQILYRTPGQTPESGSIWGFSVTNGVKSEVETEQDFTSKYIVVARTP